MLACFSNSMWNWMYRAPMEFWNEVNFWQVTRLTLLSQCSVIGSICVTLLLGNFVLSLKMLWKIEKFWYIVKVTQCYKNQATNTYWFKIWEQNITTLKSLSYKYFSSPNENHLGKKKVHHCHARSLSVSWIRKKLK